MGSCSNVIRKCVIKMIRDFYFLLFLPKKSILRALHLWIAIVNSLNSIFTDGFILTVQFIGHTGCGWLKCYTLILLQEYTGWLVNLSVVSIRFGRNSGGDGRDR